MRVAMAAQVLPGGGAGGVEQFVMGLVYGLGQLDDSPDEYLIVHAWQNGGWLEPYLGPNQRLVSAPQPRERQLGGVVQRVLGPAVRPASWAWRHMRPLLARTWRAIRPEVATSNGFYEALGADVVHFPYQGYVRCDVPTVYNPHDLQHLHFPQFFTPQQISARETVYRAGCRLATIIAVESAWVKEDLVRQYGLRPDRVQVSGWGAPTELYGPVGSEDLVRARDKFDLPAVFAFYPAQTWPHKNHMRLVEAIRLVRDQYGVPLPLICTGRKNAFWPAIERRIVELGVEDQIRFLGFVSPTELVALYRLAQFVVFPSLFEGGGFPVVEAFREGTPIACSSATSLPEYGGDAALLFDPTSVESIAAAMHRLTTDSDLRLLLRQRGAIRSRLFTWERMARTYRALYRKAAGCCLCEEDQALLAVQGVE